MKNNQPMTAEREAAILERSIDRCGEKGSISGAIGAFNELSEALDRYLCGQCSGQEVVDIMGQACVEINILELIFGDATEFEIAELERMDALLREAEK